MTNWEPKVHTKEAMLNTLSLMILLINWIQSLSKTLTNTKNNIVCNLTWINIRTNPARETKMEVKRKWSQLTKFSSQSKTGKQTKGAYDHSDTSIIWKNRRSVMKLNLIGCRKRWRKVNLMTKGNVVSSIMSSHCQWLKMCSLKILNSRKLAKAK